jgi:hypothetical protein
MDRFYDTSPTPSQDLTLYKYRPSEPSFFPYEACCWAYCSLSE